MTRWFRHYAGLCRDDKLVRVALKSKQSVERVVWVWAAILESASEIDDHGRFDFDVGEAAYFLRADEADISAICSSLECLGRISAGAVAKWDDRQFVSDRSAERQKRYRDKQKSHHDHNANVEVTSLSRHGDAPELETETELETEVEKKEPREARPLDTRDLSVKAAEAKARHSYDPVAAAAVAAEAFSRFWTAYPHKVGKPDAARAFLKVASEVEPILDGLERYIAGKPSDRSWLNPSTFINQRRWEDRPAQNSGVQNGQGQRGGSVSEAISQVHSSGGRFSIGPRPDLIGAGGGSESATPMRLLPPGRG